LPLPKLLEGFYCIITQKRLEFVDLFDQEVDIQFGTKICSLQAVNCSVHTLVSMDIFR
jgi:hypothetical protein